MTTTTLILNEGTAEEPSYGVVTIDGQRSTWNAAPDRSSLAQAQALAAYILAIRGGTLLTTGETIVAPSGQTLTAV